MCYSRNVLHMYMSYGVCCRHNVYVMHVLMSYGASREPETRYLFRKTLNCACVYSDVYVCVFVCVCVYMCARVKTRHLKMP